MEATKVLHKHKVLAPKLRFKGFNDKWEKKTLFDISENVSYGMNAAATDYDGVHKYIRITDIDVNSGEFKPDPLTSPLGEIDEKFKLKKGDIVFARTGASVGKSHLYNPKDGALYFAGFLIKFSITKANPFFIYSLTLKEAYNKWVHIYSMRSGQPGLNAEEYKALKLNIPDLVEQQKIASFLSAVDEKIQQLTRKKELLEQYKKGVMQKLFSGKLRFKDKAGKAFPKWEQKMFYDLLSEVLDFRGRTPLKIGMDWGGDILSLSANNVKDGYIDLNAECNMASEELYQKWMGKVNLEKGDIVFTMEAPLGKALLVPDNKKYILSQRVVAFKTIKEVNNQFLIQLIWSKQFQSMIERLSTGSTAKGINQKSFKKVKISIPCFSEQEKIADYLSNIDNKIEIVNKQITETQTFKTGLLQQMFV